MRRTASGLMRVCAAGLFFALAIPFSLTACARPFEVDRERADDVIPVGTASVNPLRTDKEFQAAMSGYPVIRDAFSNAVNVPGLYGAYGLAAAKDGYVLARSDGFTPQGLALSEEFVFISAYDHDRQLNSVIFILDLDGRFIKTISLDNKAHVGGIGYDSERGVLWVGDRREGRAVISAVEQEVIDSYDIESKQPVEYGLSFYIDSLPATSSLSFSEDVLWAGNFSNEAEESQLQLFSLEFADVAEGDDVTLTRAGDSNHVRITESGEIHITADVAFRTPKEVQGIAWDGEYLYLAQSFGTKDSKLSRYEPVLDGEDATFGKGRSIALPPYLEQVAVAENDEANYVIPLFESAQPTYRKKVDAFVDRVVALTRDAFEDASAGDREAPQLTEIPVTVVDGD